MKDWFVELEQALKGPQLIQSSCDSGTCYYYRLTGRRFSRHSEIYIGVVVERNDSARTGRVKTAHLLKSLRPKGETILWIRSRR